MEHFGNDLLWIIETKDYVDIDEHLGSKLQDVVSDELISFGLDENDVPNEYGLLLEDLIDEIGKQYIR